MNQKNLKHYLKWTVLSALSGLFAGVGAAVFLILLDIATIYRENNLWIIGGLPIAGFIIGWVYHNFAQETAQGHNLILDEIHNPQKIIPLRMAPLALFGTLITHLFGGSAGREGTSVQMGATFSDQLSRFFKVESAERKILLVAGAGAGFGAAIGTPWAGVIFGMEIINIGRLRLFAWFECLIASFVGYYITVLLRAPHSIYPIFDVGFFSFKNLFFVLVAGIFFGLSARVFVGLTHLIEKINCQWITYPPLRPFFGGILLVILFYLEGSYQFTGLGIPVIQNALISRSSIYEPVFKIFFTALTIGSGFKGGEFIPLVFIGTTLGSFLSVFLPISFKLLAAVGFAAVFAGASNAPIACSIMAIEIFGIGIAPYAFCACFVSYYFSGHSGIYKSQKNEFKKHALLLSRLKWLGELPKRKSK